MENRIYTRCLVLCGTYYRPVTRAPGYRRTQRGFMCVWEMQVRSAPRVARNSHCTSDKMQLIRQLRRVRCVTWGRETNFRFEIGKIRCSRLLAAGLYGYFAVRYPVQVYRARKEGEKKSFRTSRSPLNMDTLRYYRSQYSVFLRKFRKIRCEIFYSYLQLQVLFFITFYIYSLPKRVKIHNLILILLKISKNNKLQLISCLFLCIYYRCANYEFIFNTEFKNYK